jgi:hypothetical protein
MCSDHCSTVGIYIADRNNVPSKYHLNPSEPPNTFGGIHKEVNFEKWRIQFDCLLASHHHYQRVNRGRLNYYARRLCAAFTTFIGKLLAALRAGLLALIHVRSSSSMRNGLHILWGQGIALLRVSNFPM